MLKLSLAFVKYVCPVSPLTRLPLNLTDDARNQSDLVWHQPPPQVHGLMVDKKRAEQRLVEHIR